MHFGSQGVHEKNKANQDRYNLTAYMYDILDFPWELQYRQWRPDLIGISGAKLSRPGWGQAGI